MTSMPSGIRVATLDDAAGVAAVYAPYVESTVISFEVTPPGPDEMRRRMADVLAQFPWLVSEHEGTIVGYAYASAHRTRAAYQWSVDVGIYLERRAHRQGIGRQLYAALFQLLQRQGFVNAYAGITLPNPASVGLHEALGFVPVGVYRQVGFKLGGWHDVGWWHLQLQPPASAPHAPVPFHALEPTQR
jgi:phosphinothricin acetyltransferase